MYKTRDLHIIGSSKVAGKRKIPCVAASVVTLSVAMSAHAALADTPAAMAASVSTPPVTPDTTAAATPADPGAGEITVTARRRVENLELTPVSATVLSSGNLSQQNVRNFQDLRGAVSNLEVVPLLSGGTSFTVRGIGQTSNQVNTDAKAGFYVDEMYVGRQEGNDLYFYDISSLQVLKGPQGTLFGKNTTAGAITLTTNRPTDQFGGYGQVRAGSYHRLDTEGAINVPIADGLYSRLSFRTQNSDGFIKHILDDGRSGNIDNKSVRGQIRGETGRLTVDLLGEYNQSNTDGGATIMIGCQSPTSAYQVNYNKFHTSPYCSTYPILNKGNLVYGGATLTVPTSALVTELGSGGDASSSNLTRHGHRGPFNDTDVTTVNGRLNYALTDSISIHSVTAYRKSNASWYTPTVDAPNDIYAEYDNTRTSQVTQELTLGGSALDKRLNFVGGLYYYHQNTSFLQDTGPDWIDPLGYLYNGRVKYDSYAAFAQASFKFTPRLELTLGGRYTHDRKSGDSYVFYASNTSKSFIGTLPGSTTPQTLACVGYVNQFLGGITNCAGAPFTAAEKRSWNSFDPKVQLSYRLTDQIFTYVTASHGYNAGGFNQQLGFQTTDGRFPSSYDPEKLWSYEGGVKGDLFNHRVILNLAGFYQKYSSIQSTVIVLINNLTTRQLLSSGTAHEAGFEGEFTLRPTQDLTLRGNVSYLTQAYDKVLPGALIGLDTPVSSAPKYTFSAAVDYTFHVGANGTLTPSADVRGIGSKPGCYTNGTATVPQVALCKLRAYALVGVRLDFTPNPDGPWRAAFYGTNIFNKTTELARTGYTGSMGIDRYTPGRPAEFGIEASYKF